ncbi:hypothetical protein J8TS2_32810 [Lederbergia ruris]|uniref:Uncharacterized protein n=1 Tax=Lederbergia ruris TaxID=217495 RepID=A0ABQ4KLZ9_9BACI|nr:hypothetical protein J8TS2_32810 [Lederbergia ruris]
MNMNRSMVMISIFVATFLAAAESSIVTTAMPKIVGSLQGIKLMNGVFTVYLLAIVYVLATLLLPKSNHSRANHVTKSQ